MKGGIEESRYASELSEVTQATQRYNNGELNTTKMNLQGSLDMFNGGMTNINKKPNLMPENCYVPNKQVGVIRGPRRTNVINNQVFGQGQYTQKPQSGFKYGSPSPATGGLRNYMSAQERLTRAMSVHTRSEDSQSSPNIRVLGPDMNIKNPQNQSVQSGNLPEQIQNLIKQREFETGGSVKTFIVRANGKGAPRM